MNSFHLVYLRGIDSSEATEVMKAQKMFQAIVLLGWLISTPALVAAQTSAIASRPNQGDASNEVVRVDTNLITIPARVMDRDGRYITDLKREDFQVFEDGVEQEVAFFSPVEQPFTILFLLDVSGSMGRRLSDLGHAANVFLNQLRPDDQLIAMEFSDKVRVLCEATVREVREGKKLRLHPGGDTLLYDAIDDALKRMKKMRGRKAIVLFSDGYGSGIFADVKENLRDAEEQDAIIYTVQFDTYPAVPSHPVTKEDFKLAEKANNYMRDLAQKTGGRCYRIESLSDLVAAFGMVAEELRRQYSMGYYPKTKLEAGQRRQIKVKVLLPNLAVRTRDSYIVDKDRAKGN
jgi:Ca-activated chloride channel homolog